MKRLLGNISVDSKIKSWAVLNHILVIFGLIYYFSWASLFIGYLIGYTITLIGISIGYHRYFTHKSFETTPFITRILMLIGSLAFLGPVIGWTGIHRLHHATSDTEKDPHSPRNGFLKSWFHIFHNKDVPFKIVSDLLKDPMLRFQHKYYFLLITIYFVLMYLILGTTAIYVVSFPAVYLYHITGMVNSLHHLTPDKKYTLNNDSLDLPILNILTAGESYHAYHHHKANSSIFGKYDPARLVLPFIGRNL